MMKYVTPSQIVNDPNFPFTQGTLRRWMELRHQNGLDLCIRKIGRRLYIRLDLFESWIEDHCETSFT